MHKTNSSSSKPEFVKNQLEFLTETSHFTPPSFHSSASNNNKQEKKEKKGDENIIYSNMRNEEKSIFFIELTQQDREGALTTSLGSLFQAFMRRFENELR